MRLVDADKLKKDLKSVTLSNGTLLNTNTVLALLDKCPTAYDVDKVKGQMKELVEHPCGKSGKCIHAYDNFNEEYGGCEMCVALRADDIVKAGDNP